MDETKQKLPRKLAAIFYADVAGYSRLTGENEDYTHRLLSEYLDLLAKTVEQNQGEVIHYAGDAVLAKFDAVINALTAARIIQDSLYEKNREIAEQNRVEFRIGLNLGDVIEDRGDIYGDGVNVAARLEALAKPGGICISELVRSSIGNKVDLDYEYMGEQKVKNIEQPIRAYHVVFPNRETELPASPKTQLETGERPVVAVLPFQNMGSSSEDEYFADGLTEDIITALSRFRELGVIARNSTFRYKSQAVDVSQVGRELNAGYILEGSVRRAANRIRITAQLIRASDGTHLWADRYDRELEDIFAVQDEVTQTIAAALGVRLQDAAREIAMRKSPADFNAYDCVLRARRYTITLAGEEHASARDLLEKAIKLDPNYADAYALLANVYLAEHRFNANPRENPIERAEVMAQKAIELDPQNAYARCWLAITRFFRHEKEGFRQEAQRALALNPNDPEILAEMGHYYAFLGEFEQGVELTCRAIALNPLHPGWYHFCFARKHLADGDYATALAVVCKTDLPDFYWLWLIKAAALGHMGDKERAAKALARLNTLMPGFSARDELYKWNAEPVDRDQILAGLDKAGYREQGSD
jgi:TolB-like protein